MASLPSKVSQAEGINLERLTLPSSGLLTSGATFGPPPAFYVPKKKETLSKVEVTTDPSSLLIRCLQSKKKATAGGAHAVGKQRSSSSHDEKKRKAQGTPGASGSAGGSAADGVNAQKKHARDVQRTVYSKETLLQMPVARLKGICSEKNIAQSGKKIDLIERILDHQ